MSVDFSHKTPICLDKASASLSADRKNQTGNLEQIAKM